MFGMIEILEGLVHFELIYISFEIFVNFFPGYLAVLALAFLELWIWDLYRLFQSSHLCVSVYGC